MKIFLQKNWSEQFVYGDDTPGVFVGREQEVEGLKSVINNNNSSATLVSSVRGVGKTSFVHKALSELEDTFPIFVNIGHTLLREEDEEERSKKEKKAILSSLIRAVYFNEKLKSKLNNKDNEKKLKELYEKSVGTYYIERQSGDKKESTTKFSFKMNLDINPKDIVSFTSILIGFLLSIFGVIFKNPIFSGFGVSAVLFSTLAYYREKSYHVFSKSEEGTKIDDTTEYLEIEFENWLKTQKNKKIVFVIDELDKINSGDEEKTFNIIKEYKNLFTRSFAQFIFIADQKAFDLVNEDREDDKKGIFPTFFTHIFYLSLPSADEIRLYLNQIFDVDENVNIDEKEKNELINYLLFCSGNDFFSLKRLLEEVILFESDDGKSFIDSEKIKKTEVNFSKVSELFGWLEKWFLKKNLNELKKYWKDNSNLQKEIFKFLNKNFNKNFFHDRDIKNNTNLENLVDFLIYIGIVEKNPASAENGLEKGDFKYIWTKKYKRNIEAPLTEDDRAFQESFNNLVKLANDLDDLPSVYNGKKFTNEPEILEEADGQNLSGINLYSIYEDYKDIYNRLKDSSQRISVATKRVRTAKKLIDEQIGNVRTKYFEILNNLIQETLKKESILGKYLVNSPDHSVQSIFNALPGFLSIVNPETYETAVWCNPEKGKYVLLIRYFEDEERITPALATLRNNKKLLIINITDSEEHEKVNPIIYKDSAGRKRKKGMVVNNFINFEFYSFRQFIDLLTLIEKYLN